MQRSYPVNAAPASRRPVARAAAPARGDALMQIFPLALLIYSVILLPPEAQFQFSGVNLPIYRIVILALIPLMIGRFASGRAKVGVADWLMLAISAWMIFSFVHVYGIESGIVRGFGVVVDTAGAFLVARVSIDSTTALRRLLIVIAPGMLLAGLEILIESVTHRAIVRPAFAAVFGYVANYEGGQVVGAFDFSGPQEIRLGLLRAWGPFPHPILGGIILTSMLPLWLMGGIRSWPRLAGLISALLGLFTISSAAFLALAMGLAFCSFDRFKRHIPSVRWPLIATVMMLALLAVQLASKNGVVRVLARLTLDPQTAYYRILIWRYGLRSVAEHPVYGIGFKTYERPSGMTSSIDAHFLLLGVRNGVVAPVLLLTVFFVTMIRLGQRSTRVGGSDGNLFVAVNFMLVVLLISGLTVTFFGSANVWLMAIVGICATLLGARVSTPTYPQTAVSGGRIEWAPASAERRSTASGLSRYPIR